MNINKELVSRVYIVLAVCWYLWLLYVWGKWHYRDGLREETFIGLLIPIPLYFAIKWILKSIK